MLAVVKRVIGWPFALLHQWNKALHVFLLKHVVPLSWHTALRDSGGFRVLGDVGAWMLGLSLALFRPSMPFELLSTRRAMQCFSYQKTYLKVSAKSDASPTPASKKVFGLEHVLEIIELEDTNNSSTSEDEPVIETERLLKKRVRPVLVFVHGGAWGSGRTWQYTLIAKNYGELINASHVVVVGYPYYPDATVLEQRDSVLAAVYHLHCSEEMQRLLALKTPGYESDALGSEYRPIVLSGHSSGANICALALFHHYHFDGDGSNGAEGISTKDALLPHGKRFVDLFVGLSGVYDIEKHYEYESSRGVQHVSPMGAAAIGTEHFWKSSPTLLYQRKLSQSSEKTVQEENEEFPFVTVVHGDVDDVVPHSSSLEYEQVLQQHSIPIDSYYPKIDHVRPILDLMEICSNDTKQCIVASWQKFIGHRFRNFA